MEVVLNNRLVIDGSINMLNAIKKVVEPIIGDPRKANGYNRQQSGGAYKLPLVDAKMAQWMIVGGRALHLLGGVGGLVSAGRGMFNELYVSNKGPEAKYVDIAVDNETDAPLGPEQRGGGKVVDMLFNVTDKASPALAALGLGVSIFGLYQKLQLYEPAEEASALYLTGKWFIVLACASILVNGYLSPAHYFHKVNNVLLGSVFTLGTLVFIIGTAFHWGDVDKNDSSYEALRKVYARTFGILVTILFVSLWILVLGIARTTQSKGAVAENATVMPFLTSLIVVATFGVSSIFEVRDLIDITRGDGNAPAVVGNE